MPPEPETPLALSSRAVHADDAIASHRAVAPAMHVSTTFRYHHDPDQLQPCSNLDVSPDCVASSTPLPSPVSVPAAVPR